jgi:voltage-gated potassium channel
MARFMLNPSIEDFLEIADDRGNELELADVQIDANSPYVGKPLAETDLRDKGVMVIGIRRANGERLMPPPGSTVLHSGDSLFAFGSAESVNTMIGDNGPTDS